jgi:hypothetical protein
LKIVKKPIAMFWKLLSKRQKETPSSTWLDSILGTTKAWGLHISGWLQRKTQGLSSRQLKRYSVLILLVGASWNGWIIVEALRPPSPSISGRQLHLSHPILPSVQPPADPSSLESIKKFRSWLDSLQADSAGKKIYDSIRQQRPGLLDSLGQIQKDYSIHH